MERRTALAITSALLLALALFGLVLPWDDIDGSGTRTGLRFVFPEAGTVGPPRWLAVILVTGVAVASIGSFRRSHRAAVIRAAFAAIALGPFLAYVLMNTVLGGDPILLGAWVSFVALAAAAIVNIVMAVDDRSPSPLPDGRRFPPPNPVPSIRRADRDEHWVRGALPPRHPKDRRDSRDP